LQPLDYQNDPPLQRAIRADGTSVAAFQLAKNGSARPVVHAAFSNDMTQNEVPPGDSGAGARLKAEPMK